MGTFEKLGILVIVVIIVMILAVAISQWGGIADPVGGTVGVPELSAPLEVDLEALAGRERERGLTDSTPPPKPPAPDGLAGATWPGGIPKLYEVQKNDKLWAVVVKRWELKESFVQAIQAANPRVQFTRLMPGDKIAIPDPEPYRPGATARDGTRPYQVQVGDNLEYIARTHLGRRARWKEIQTLNPHVDARKLKPGDVLAIPVK